MNHHTDHSCCGCGSHGEKTSCGKSAALRHWVKLRLASFMLVPLVVWLVASIVSLIGSDYATFTEWMSRPVNAGLLGLFVVFGCYHGALGVQEIIEDYVSHEKAAQCAIDAQKLAFAVVAAVCLVSIGMIVL